MRKENHILKVFGLFLSLLLFATVLPKEVERVQHDFEKTSQNTDQDDEQKTTLSECPSDYVIPSVAFYFGSDFLLLPCFDFCILVLEETFAVLSKPLFRISYFEKLFELHIAINAP